MKWTSRTARQTGVSRAWGLIVCALLIMVINTKGVWAANNNKVPTVGTWMVDLTPMSSSDTINDTIAALPKDLTVLALQGVNLDEDDLTAFKEAVQQHYPFSYHVPPGTPDAIGCAPVLPESVCENVLGLRTTDCAIRIAADMLGCIVDYSLPLAEVSLEDVLRSPCGGQAGLLLLLDQQCTACLLNTGAKTGGNPQQTYNTCVAQQGPRFAFGGSVGQLILSKHPISDIEVVEFASYQQRRANVYATINGLRYGFASYPSDILADAGLSAFVPALPADLQPVLAQEMLASDAEVLLGNFSSGTQYQPDAYEDLLTGFQDLAPEMLTHCTQAMKDAMDPRCITQTSPSLIFRTSTDVDHVFTRDSSEGCFWAATPRLFGETSGASDHAGLRVCNSPVVFEDGLEAPSDP